MPKISVIIPTLNEEKDLPLCIESISKQEFIDYEIIVADGGSTDGTKDIAGRYGAKFVLETKKGAAAGRNAGARAAAGELLVFIDADTKAEQGWLAAYWNAYEKEKFVAATGPIHFDVYSNKFEKVGVSAWNAYYYAAVKMKRPLFAGPNCCFTKKAFKEAGGFDENLLTFEDCDLSLRVAKLGKVSYVKDAIAYTSRRRVEKWGYGKFLGFHTSNLIRGLARKKTHTHYEHVR